MATPVTPQRSAVSTVNLLRCLCNRSVELIEGRLATTPFPPPVLLQALLECSALAAIMKSLQFLQGHGKLPVHLNPLLEDGGDKSIINNCMRALDDLEGLLEPYPNQDKPPADGELSSLQSLLDHILALKAAVISETRNKSL